MIGFMNKFTCSIKRNYSRRPSQRTGGSQGGISSILHADFGLTQTLPVTAQCLEW
jgi:hypothetical protein